MDVTELREQRRRAGLSLAAVAGALNRTKGWLCNIERGRAVADSDMRRRIGEAIKRLRSLRESTWGRARELSDLKLPDAKNRQIARR